MAPIDMSVGHRSVAMKDERHHAHRASYGENQGLQNLRNMATARGAGKGLRNCSPHHAKLFGKIVQRFVGYVEQAFDKKPRDAKNFN